MAEETKKSNLSIWHIIVVAMVALQMFTNTLTSSGISVIVNGAKMAYDLNGTQTALVFTIKNLAAFIWVFFAVKYYEVLGIRKGVTLAFIFGAIAYFIMSIAGANLMLYYVAAVIAGAGYAYGMALPMAYMITNWFNKNRTMAMSFCSAGTGFTAMVLTPVLQSVINSAGLSQACMTAVALFCVMAVLYFLLMRDTPAERGLEPFGGADYSAVSDAGSKKSSTNGGSINMAPKWPLLLTVGGIILGICCAPAQSNFIIHFNHAGYDSMLVAAAYGVCGGCLICSKLLFGVLSTKIKIQHISRIFIAGYLASYIIASLADGSNTMIPYVTCFVYGLSGAVCTLGLANWMTDFTTASAYQGKLKTAQFLYQGGEIVGALMPGLIADATGGYNAYYLVLAVLNAILIAIITICYRARNKAIADGAVPGAALDDSAPIYG